MKIESFTKQDIASRQIETALRLFFEGGDIFSVITLAGAAEEILGQLLPQEEASSLYGKAVASIFQIFRPRGQKPPEQERFSGHELDTSVHLDPDHEARFLLGRAIDDYLAVTGDLSTAMARFRAEAQGRQR